MECREDTADDQIYKQYPDNDRNDLDDIVNIDKCRIVIFGLFDKFVGISENKGSLIVFFDYQARVTQIFTVI